MTTSSPTLVVGTPTDPGFYYVRGQDIDVPIKVVLYLRTGAMWLHRPECRDAVDLPMLDQFSSWFHEWVKIEPFWIQNGPHAPPIRVGDRVTFPYYEAYASGYVEEKWPGWMKIHAGPSVSPSHVVKFIPRNGVAIPAGATFTPLTELPGGISSWKTGPLT